MDFSLEIYKRIPQKLCPPSKVDYDKIMTDYNAQQLQTRLKKAALSGSAKWRSKLKEMN